MEHSIAVLEEAGKPAEAPSDDAPNAVRPSKHDKADNDGQPRSRTNNYDRRKRKADHGSSSMQHGSRGHGRNDSKRHKKGDMGRGEYFRDEADKRAKVLDTREKRVQGDGPSYGPTFSREEIDAEARRPKRKVAVFIGYAGTGYRGMQISPGSRTIEGDLFQAFVEAGAISKANADDPKKASLVRCARTDKGVHAAGNMISLKLIVEDKDIVQKINAALPAQIRVWGIERTIGSFSCYQACDSRWYEYLIPSHAFLPPHPSSWLAKKLEEFADVANDRAGYESRQRELKGFWEKVEEDQIRPIIDAIDEDIRWEVVKALQGEDEASAKAAKSAADVDAEATNPRNARTAEQADEDEEEDGLEADDTQAGDAAVPVDEPDLTPTGQPVEANESTSQNMCNSAETDSTQPPRSTQDVRPSAPTLPPKEIERIARLRAATKSLRNAYLTAKRRFRLPPERIARVQTALACFVGTNNYHNYTVQKTFRDPSARRHIKFFGVNRTPILIGDGPDEDKSEWLSLKVHGQSFMMHQIRKMIGMAALLVRCGSDIRTTLPHSLGEPRYAIPKVPGLGLLLERPVFDTYNHMQAPKHQRNPLRFDQFETEIAAFKQSEIYARIFREEERNEFARFFNHVDNFREPWFLYVTSKGLAATKGEEVGEKSGVDGHGREEND